MPEPIREVILEWYGFLSPLEIMQRTEYTSQQAVPYPA